MCTSSDNPQNSQDVDLGVTKASQTAEEATPLPNQNLSSKPQILHQGEKPGFLRMTNSQTLYFWLRNPVFLVWLRMVQDLSKQEEILTQIDESNNNNTALNPSQIKNLEATKHGSSEPLNASLPGQTEPSVKINSPISNIIYPPQKPLWEQILRRVIQFISVALWVALILVIMAHLGQWLTFSQAKAGTLDAGLTIAQTVQSTLREDELYSDIEAARKDAQTKALKLAKDELDAWNNELMSRVDENFLDWYFGYWNQQLMGLKGLAYSVIHSLNNKFPTAVEKLTLETQREFEKRVLVLPVSKQRLARINRDVIRCYTRELRKNLYYNVRKKYSLPEQNWNEIQNNITWLVRDVDGKTVSFPMKTFIIASGPGALALGKITLLGIEKVTSKIPAQFVGKAVAKMAAKTGAEFVGIGSELLGPIVTVAILAWDAWDINETGKQAKPLLRKNLLNNFNELNDTIINDNEYGIDSILDNMEVHVKKSIQFSNSYSNPI